MGWFTRKKAVAAGAVLGAGMLAAALAPSVAGATPAALSGPRASVTSASPAMARGAVVGLAAEPKVGAVLVDAAGHTLYLFSADANHHPHCTGSCATAWPPLLTTAKPVAGKGVKAGLLGTVRDPDGKVQVTYHGWPLYTFSADTKPHEATGQGIVAFGGKWAAVNAAGTGVGMAMAPTMARGAMVGLASEAKVGAVLVDASGHTLYAFSKDADHQSHCTGACATAWPPLLTTAKPVAGKGVKAGLLGTVRDPDGKVQVTYHGWPLYTFKGDTKAHEATGQGIVAFGGKWAAVNAAGNPAGATTTSSSSPSGGGW